MWLRIQHPSQDLYIVVYYFPQETSHFARILREETETSTYFMLYPNIMEFSSHGEVLLVEDFNARTSTCPEPLLGFHCDSILLPEVDADDAWLSLTSADRRAPVTTYGHALLDMGRIHDLVIYNGMSP